MTGIAKISQVPLPGEMCYVPMGEKLQGPYGKMDPKIYSASLGMEISEQESTILDRFAMKPLVYQQCNKLDDAG